MAFFRSYIAPFLIVLIFVVAMIAVSARIVLPSDMMAPAPIEAPANTPDGTQSPQAAGDSLPPEISSLIHAAPADAA